MNSKQFQEDEYKRRKELAVYWYNKASDLRGSAGALWVSMDDSTSGKMADKLGLGAGFSFKAACYPVYLMLCGMALELVFKAIIVAQNQEPPSIHNLIELARKADVEYSDDEEGLMQILSESVIWEGKYPVPKKQEHLEQFNELCLEHLYDKASLGSLEVLKSNDSLSWESVNNLWKRASNLY